MFRRGWIVRFVAIGVCAVAVCAAGALTARAQETQEPEGLKVTESGVGTAVVDRDLQGRAESFPEETEVWFWTRVEGGAEGDYLVHVWLRNGEEVHRYELRVGGAHWRTWSNKTMHAGSAGEWTVEARNEDGVVLARETFRCTAAE